MASFVLSFFPLDVLDEIWDVESVSEGFLTYSFTEYCPQKHLWSIVWMQQTSVCDFEGGIRKKRAFVKNDATIQNRGDKVFYDQF